MKEKVKAAGLADRFEIASAATSREELGNPVYSPARKELAKHHISCKGKTARQMTWRDYEAYDYLIGMDHWNLKNMLNICGGDPAGKISLLLDHTDHPRDVADPWYIGDYETTWDDIDAGCDGLLMMICNESEDLQ